MRLPTSYLIAITLGLGAILGILIYSYRIESALKKDTCADIGNYASAKALFDLDPVKYSYLDRNKDGKPCNILIKRHV